MKKRTCSCEIHIPDGEVLNVICKDVKNHMLQIGRALHYMEGKECSINGKASFLAEKIQVCHEIQRRMLEQEITGAMYMEFRKVKLEDL